MDGRESPAPASGLLDRGIAKFVDGLVLGLGMGIFAIGIYYSGFRWSSVPGGELTVNLVGLGIFVGYFSAFEGHSGRTVGKRVMNLQVLSRDGSRCGLRDAIIRNLLRPIDALPNFYLLGIVSILASKRNQRIGDHLANTVVITTDGLEEHLLNDFEEFSVSHRRRTDTGTELFEADIRATQTEGDVDPVAKTDWSVVLNMDVRMIGNGDEGVADFETIASSIDPSDLEPPAGVEVRDIGTYPENSMTPVWLSIAADGPTVRSGEVDIEQECEAILEKFCQQW